MVCKNQQLAAMIKARPQSMAKLGTIDGIGKAKLEKYGQEILTLLAWPRGASAPPSKPARDSDSAAPAKAATPDQAPAGTAGGGRGGWPRLRRPDDLRCLAGLSRLAAPRRPSSPSTCASRSSTALTISPWTSRRISSRRATAAARRPCWHAPTCASRSCASCSGLQYSRLPPARCLRARVTPGQCRRGDARRMAQAAGRPVRRIGHLFESVANFNALLAAERRARQRETEPAGCRPLRIPSGSEPARAGVRAMHENLFDASLPDISRAGAGITADLRGVVCHIDPLRCCGFEPNCTVANR